VPKNHLRRRAAASTVIAVLLVASGCQMAKAGSRCKAGSPLARDTTHVLACRNGKWVRTITVGEAAAFLIGKLPGSLEDVSRAVNAGVGSNAPVGLVVRAKTRNGEVSEGVNVSMELPASGPSGTLVSASVVETDAEGLARFSYVPNTVAGQFRPRARIVDTAITVDLFAANEAGQFTTLVPISGNGQTTGLQLPFASPFRARTLDQYGNPVNGVPVAIDYDDSFVSFLGNEADLESDGSGYVDITLYSGIESGSDYLLIGALDGAGILQVVRFDFSVAPGPVFEVQPNPGFVEVTIGAAAVPIAVKAIDGYQNLIPNIDLQLATRNAPGSTGAVALSAASVRTGNDGFAYFSVEGTVAGEVQIVVNAPGRPEAELMSVNVLAP
jgi:hypothetical protein